MKNVRRETTITKLHDRFVVLMNGDAAVSSFVYAHLEAPLTASATDLGALARSGLKGNRNLSKAEAVRFMNRAAANPLFADFDEWDERYPSVCVIDTGNTMYELRAFVPTSSRPTILQVSSTMSDREFGEKIQKALTPARPAKKVPVRKKK